MRRCLLRPLGLVRAARCSHGRFPGYLDGRCGYDGRPKCPLEEPLAVTNAQHGRPYAARGLYCDLRSRPEAFTASRSDSDRQEQLRPPRGESRQLSRRHSHSAIGRSAYRCAHPMSVRSAQRRPPIEECGSDGRASAGSVASLVPCARVAHLLCDTVPGGIPRHPLAEAARKIRLAAEQVHGDAQSNPGRMFQRGGAASRAAASPAEALRPIQARSMRPASAGPACDRDYGHCSNGILCTQENLDKENISAAEPVAPCDDMRSRSPAKAETQAYARRASAVKPAKTVRFGGSQVCCERMHGAGCIPTRLLPRDRVLSDPPACFGCTRSPAPSASRLRAARGCAARGVADRGRRAVEGVAAGHIVAGTARVRHGRGGV